MTNSNGTFVGKLHPEDVAFVVNDARELGVRIGEQFFWLYQGKAIELPPRHTDGTPRYWREVRPREFGEVCRPLDTRLADLSTSFVEGPEWRVFADTTHVGFGRRMTTEARETAKEAQAAPAIALTPPPIPANPMETVGGGQQHTQRPSGAVEPDHDKALASRNDGATADTTATAPLAQQPTASTTLNHGEAGAHAPAVATGNSPPADAPVATQTVTTTEAKKDKHPGNPEVLSDEIELRIKMNPSALRVLANAFAVATTPGAPK